MSDYVDAEGMKRVLVTGASGFIGSHCLLLLTPLAEELHAVYYHPPAQTNASVIPHHVDLMDARQVEHLIATVQPTHLMHLAWDTTPGDAITSTRNIQWLQASLNLIESFQRHGGQRVFVAGTCLEYEAGNSPLSAICTPAKPKTMYGACKLALQQVLAGLSHHHGLGWTWGRIFYVYGPGEHPERLVPNVITSLLADQPARCTHGEQVRDYLHVADVAQACVTLLNSDVEGVFNIASGQPIRLKDMVDTIARKLGKEHLIELGALPARTDEPPFLVADISHTFEQLNWRPEYTLETGLENTIAWWQTQLDKDIECLSNP